jgi:hypothetical protein
LTPEQDLNISSYAVDDGGSGGYNRQPVDNDSESEKDQKAQREATGSSYSYYKEREISYWENKFNWGQSSTACSRSCAEKTQEIMDKGMSPSTKVNVAEPIYMHVNNPVTMYDGMGSVWGKPFTVPLPKPIQLPKTIPAPITTPIPNLPYTGTYTPIPAMTNPLPVQTNPLGVPGVTVQMMNKVSESAGTPSSTDSGSNSPETPDPKCPESDRINCLDKDTGEFEIVDWEGCPENVPQPKGPFKILEDSEYTAARDAANKAALRGLDIHEIHPVKFGGSPTDLSNKVALKRGDHSPVTNWWNRLQNDIGY